MPAVPQEIERKFHVANDGRRAGADQGSGLRQAYLAETDRAVVRVRIEDGARGVLAIKSAGIGMSWAGREVTGAAEYYAARLARRPYASRPSAERLQDG